MKTVCKLTERRITRIESTAETNPGGRRNARFTIPAFGEDSASGTGAQAMRVQKGIQMQVENCNKNCSKYAVSTWLHTLQRTMASVWHLDKSTNMPPSRRQQQKERISPEPGPPAQKHFRRLAVGKPTKDKCEGDQNSNGVPVAVVDQLHGPQEAQVPHISSPFLLPQVGTIREFLLVLAEYKGKLAMFLPEHYTAEALDGLTGNKSDEELQSQKAQNGVEGNQIPPHAAQEPGEGENCENNNNSITSPLTPATTRKVTEIVTTKTETKKQSPGFLGMLTGTKVVTTTTTTTTTTKHSTITEVIEPATSNSKLKIPSSSSSKRSNSFLPNIILPTLPKWKPKPSPHPTTLPLPRLWSLIVSAPGIPPTVKKLARETGPLALSLSILPLVTSSIGPKEATHSSAMKPNPNSKYHLIHKHVYKRLYHTSKEEWKLLEKLILGGIDEMLRDYLGLEEGEIRVMESITLDVHGSGHDQRWSRVTEPVLEGMPIDRDDDLKPYGILASTLSSSPQSSYSYPLKPATRSLVSAKRLKHPSRPLVYASDYSEKTDGKEQQAKQVEKEPERKEPQDSNSNASVLQLEEPRSRKSSYCPSSCSVCAAAEFNARSAHPTALPAVKYESRHGSTTAENGSLSGAEYVESTVFLNLPKRLPMERI